MYKENHLLVVVAEGVGDAQFGNIHQSTLSIPGVAIKTDKQTAGEKDWRRRSVPKSPHVFREMLVRCSWVLSPLPPLFNTHTRPNKLQSAQVLHAQAEEEEEQEKKSGDTDKTERNKEPEEGMMKGSVKKRRKKGDEGSDG